MGNDDYQKNNKDFVMSSAAETDEPVRVYENGGYEKNAVAPAPRSSMPLIPMGVGFLVLAILSIMMLSRAQDLAEKEQVLALQSTLAQLERRLADVEEFNKKMDLSGAPENQFDLLHNRIAKLESSLNSKLDAVISRPESAKPATAQKQPVSAQAPPAVLPEKKESSARIHNVKPGETLYQISRQYGLTVEQLRQYNKLGPNTNIFPGQQLKVTP